MRNKFGQGHIGRFWTREGVVNLTYTPDEVTRDEIDEIIDSGCDYIKTLHTVYSADNSTVGLQLPEWVFKFNDLFPYLNMTFSIKKLKPRTTRATHPISYDEYLKLYAVEPEQVCRIIVMVEDWRPGNYFEINGIGYTNWLAGDYFVWHGNGLTAYANIGSADMYMLEMTGTEISSTDIWHNIHWYNIPKLVTKKESLERFLCYRVLPTIKKDDIDVKADPFFVYLYNGNIPALEDIRHDQETIDYLNNKGINIYLYEPLCSYIEAAEPFNPLNGFAFQVTKHSMEFYSEFTGDEDTTLLRADELDSICKYAKANSLTNITVHTCEYDIEKYYTYYTGLKLKTNDLFLKTTIPIEVLNKNPNNNFSKKFMCLNWRYTPHRHMIAAYVAKLPSFCSWYVRGDLNMIGRSPWFNIFHWQKDNPNIFNKILSGLEYLNINAPLNVDLEIKKPINITQEFNKHMTPAGKMINDFQRYINNSIGIEKYYREIFCDIVTESRFAQPTGNYSEKVYQPMYFMKPFVLCAPPKTLQYLKEQGFKTFSDFWDESYDDEMNHEQRLFKIFKLIDFINDKSIVELRKMYDKMIPILKHNFIMLQSVVQPISVED